MKKITMVALFLSTMWGYSQIKGYTFSQSNGSYSAIHGTTTFGDSSSDTQNFIVTTAPLGTTGFTGAGIPIGFNFTFNGQVYDRFGISNDGWISLGSSTLADMAVDMKVDKMGSVPMPLSSVTAMVNELNTARIAALSADLQGQTGSAITYLTSGSEGNRELVVQWENYKRAGANANGDSFNFQIRLKETSNTIQIVYGNFNTNQTLAEVFQVGLRAEPSTVLSNFVNRTSSTGWDNTTAGAVATDRISMIGTTKPGSGLTYMWTPPTCGGAKTGLTSESTLNTATFTWNSYIPTPGGYEYVVSTSATLPMVSGKSTTAAAGSASGLDPNTAYNVFVRTYCDSQFTPWVLVGSFKTKCAEATEFFEDFQSYAATPGNVALGVPDCWVGSITALALAKIVNGTGTAAGNKMLSLFANTSALPIGSMAFATMPSVSNLQSGDHRLKFTGYAYHAGGSSFNWLDIGYYDSTGAFVKGQTINDLPASTAPQQYVVNPATWTPAIPAGVKNLVFRNSNYAPVFLYIDNVTWEPIPQACAADVKSVAANQLTDKTAVLTWTAGGSETSWQYVLDPTTVANPYALNAINVSGTSPTVSLSDLLPATNYKAWVRSKCQDGSLGAWMGPVVFRTDCAPGTEILEYFDNLNSANPIAPCWKKIGTGAVGLSTSPFPPIPTGPYAMSINGGGGKFTIAALPPMSNAGAGTHRLKFKAAINVANVTNQLVIGWLDDVTDADSFHELAIINDLSTTEYKSYEFAFGTLPKSHYLAFKNPGTISNFVKIDNVIWEPIPTCTDVALVKVEMVKSTMAELSWTKGGKETAWQYVMTSGSETDPTKLTVLDVPSPMEEDTHVNATFTGLAPNTTYKLWLRSKCDNTTFGSWKEPIIIKTPCSPVANFTANFDSSQSFPACWALAGNIGYAGPGSSNTLEEPSFPNSFYMQSTPELTVAVAMPGVSNLAAGTHKLSFKYYSNQANAKLDVGYLKNPADPYSFVSMLAQPYSCTDTFQNASIDFGTDSAPEGVEVLAFKLVGVTVIKIDDVAWLPANGILPPVNDEVQAPITLTVGKLFSDNSVFETNVGASASVQASPGCGGYNGSDVWNAAIVPATGNITFEVNSVTGGLTNTAGAVYSGSFNSLTFIECNDAGSIAGNNHPKISLSGRTPGEVLYFRVWENGGNAFGPFMVAAYDSTPHLGTDVFEVNNFAFYPNPVRDVLNLSLNQDITNVAVFNLLGQQVINQSANGNQVKIDMSDLSRGAYLVKVLSGNESKTIKVIKE